MYFDRLFKYLHTITKYKYYYWVQLFEQYSKTESFVIPCHMLTILEHFLQFVANFGRFVFFKLGHTCLNVQMISYNGLQIFFIFLYEAAPSKRIWIFVWSILGDPNIFRYLLGFQIIPIYFDTCLVNSWASKYIPIFLGIKIYLDICSDFHDICSRLCYPPFPCSWD